jgi:hypothetical protein
VPHPENWTYSTDPGDSDTNGNQTITVSQRIRAMAGYQAFQLFHPFSGAGARETKASGYQ